MIGSAPCRERSFTEEVTFEQGPGAAGTRRGCIPALGMVST